MFYDWFVDSADKWISPFAFKLRVPIDNKSNIPPQSFNCSFASSVINKNAGSTYNLRNPLTFADSAYKFCGFHLNLRIPLTLCGIHLVAEARTTSYICLLRNPQQNKCAEKMYVTGIRMRNPLKFCLWNPLTFWNMF